MNGSSFDKLVSLTAAGTPRRGVLKLACTSVLMVLGATSLLGAGNAEAKKKRKRKKRKKNRRELINQVCTPGTFVAQVQVGGNGAIVQTPVLTLGQVYRFQASGAAALGGAFSFDAEFIFANANPSTGVDVDSGVDAGLSIDDPTVDNDKSPKWGAYNPNHIYETQFIGKGAPAQLRLHDGDYTDNSGSVLVTITCA